MRNGGCQDGYIRVAWSCIRLVPTLKSFSDALQACNAEGATLAMPKVEELDLTLRRLVKMSGGDHWIGLKEMCSGVWLGLFQTCWLGKWEYKWVDGVTLHLGRYQGWHPGEPGNARVRGRALCVQYWYSGPAADPMWDDTGCHVTKRYICQSPPV
ncbi:CD209 antigen-like protein A [Branchiostoma floridae x Branchiostoma belcheri]